MSALSADDRMALVDLAHRYAHYVDERRIDDLAGLFAPDARLEFVSTGFVADGRQALTEFFTSVFATPVLAAGTAGGAESTHLMANTLVDPGDEPDTATMVTSAVAYLAAGTTVTARGITYTDACRRVDGRWLFAHRIHRLRWQGVGDGGPLRAEPSPLD